MVPFEGIGCVRFLLLLYVCASPETRGRKCSGGGRKAHCHWNLSVSFSQSASTHKTVSTPQFVTVAPHLPVKCHYCVWELCTHTSGSCTFTLRSRHFQLSFKYRWVFYTGWSFLTFWILRNFKKAELRWWSYGALAACTFLGLKVCRASLFWRIKIVASYWGDVMINEDKASIFWCYQIETLPDLSIELCEDVLFFVVCGCSLSKSNLFGPTGPWAGESLLKAQVWRF